MTCVATTSPTLLAAAAPASTALRTAATSPRTIAVTSPASIFSQPTSFTFADFTIASAASIIATSPMHSTMPSASGICLSPPCSSESPTDYSVPQGMNRGRNPSAAPDKTCRRKGVDGHDWSAAEQAAKLNHVANVFARNWNDPHRRGLIVHYADGHLISNDRRNRFCRG